MAGTIHFLIVHRLETDNRVLKDIPHLRRLYNGRTEIIEALKRERKKLRDYYYIPVFESNHLLVKKDKIGNYIVPGQDVPLGDYRVLVDDSEWKMIPDYSGYMASHLGEILTLRTGNITKGSSAGHYLKVAVKKDGDSIHKNQYVHHLVAITFYGKPTGDNIVIKHLDDNRFNNARGNLKWDTQSQNIQDYWDNKKARISMEDFNLSVSLEELNIDAGLESRAVMSFNNSGIIGSVGSFFQNSMANISGVYKRAVVTISQLTDSDSEIISKEIVEFREKSKNLIKYLDTVKYIDVYKLETPIVSGTTGTFLEINQAVIKGIDELEPYMLASLVNLNTTLAKVLSDKDYRISRRPTESKVGVLKKALADNKNILKNISTVSLADRRPIKEVLRSIREVDELIKVTDKMAELTMKSDMKKATSIIDSITERSDILISELNTGKRDIKGISNEMFKSLSEMIEVNANLVSAVTLIHSISHQQIGAVNSLLKTLNEYRK